MIQFEPTSILCLLEQCKGPDLIAPVWLIHKADVAELSIDGHHNTFLRPGQTFRLVSVKILWREKLTAQGRLAHSTGSEQQNPDKFISLLEMAHLFVFFSFDYGSLVILRRAISGVLTLSPGLRRSLLKTITAGNETLILYQILIKTLQDSGIAWRRNFFLSLGPYQ